MEKGNANLHFLDRYLGIPLVLLLGLFRIRKRKIAVPFNPSRIAILNISSIGDNVLMSGPIRDLRHTFPSAEIVIFCGETNFGVAKMIPHVSKVIKLSVTKLGPSVNQIRQEGAYDLMIDFGPWPRLNAIYSAFFNAKVKIGFKSLNQARHFVYDYPVLHSNQKHELDNFRALLEPLRISITSQPLLNYPKSTLSLPAEFILFHPWPGGYKSYMKEWPKEKWIQLASKVHQLGMTILISGAKADEAVSKQLESESQGKLKSVAGMFNLPETTYMVSKARILVTVNTGIMHLGAAIGTKMVALHGPTSVKRWGPVSKNAINVFPGNAACGYLHYGYEYDRSTVNCMELITVDEVFAAILKQLK